MSVEVTMICRLRIGFSWRKRFLLTKIQIKSSEEKSKLFPLDSV